MNFSCDRLNQIAIDLFRYVVFYQTTSRACLKEKNEKARQGFKAVKEGWVYLWARGLFCLTVLVVRQAGGRPGVKRQLADGQINDSYAQNWNSRSKTGCHGSCHNMIRTTSLSSTRHGLTIDPNNPKVTKKSYEEFSLRHSLVKTEKRRETMWFYLGQFEFWTMKYLSVYNILVTFFFFIFHFFERLCLNFELWSLALKVKRSVILNSCLD